MTLVLQQILATLLTSTKLFHCWFFFPTVWWEKDISLSGENAETPASSGTSRPVVLCLTTTLCHSVLFTMLLFWQVFASFSAVKPSNFLVVSLLYMYMLSISLTGCIYLGVWEEERPAILMYFLLFWLPSLLGLRYFQIITEFYTVLAANRFVYVKLWVCGAEVDNAAYSSFPSFRPNAVILCCVVMLDSEPLASYATSLALITTDKLHGEYQIYVCLLLLFCSGISSQVKATGIFVTSPWWM